MYVCNESKYFRERRHVGREKMQIQIRRECNLKSWPEVRGVAVGLIGVQQGVHVGHLDLNLLGLQGFSGFKLENLETCFMSLGITVAWCKGGLAISWQVLLHLVEVKFEGHWGILNRRGRWGRLRGTGLRPWESNDTAHEVHSQQDHNALDSDPAEPELG